MESISDGIVSLFIFLEKAKQKIVVALESLDFLALNADTLRR